MNDDQLRSEEAPQAGGAGDEALFIKLAAWFREDRDASADWRRDAREDYDFVAGRQTDARDAEALRAKNRPIIEFNRVAPVIKAVGGSEVNNRQEVRYVPRQVGASAVNEILTQAGKFFADETDAEDEESDAFVDASICGMGWLEMRVDYETDPDGAYVEDRINPLEMFWDGRAAGRNLKDARRITRVRRIAKDDAAAMFPDADPEDLDAAWADNRESGTHANPLGFERHHDGRSNTEAGGGNEITLVECQWWEKEPYYRVADPMTGQVAELSVEQHDTLSTRMQQMGMPLKAVRQSRRVYKRAFLGKEVLEAGASPAKDRFSYVCITGDRDHNKGSWYGLVRPMKDPQRWANKWLQQYLHILNSNAKGGLMAERGAFEDVTQAEETWAKADAITWLNDGAMSNGRIKEKPTTQLPAGHFQLLEFALSSIRDSSGVNLELLGMKSNEQAGILEHQRKQAAMTILATLFDSLRRARKMIGRVRLYYIQEFLADGRLIRVIQQDQQQYIPLAAEMATGKFDVVIDDAPASPNQKDVVWNAFQQIFPAVREMITPEIMLDVLEYSPLPTSFVEKLKQRMAEGQQQPPDPTKEAETSLTVARAQDHSANADLKRAKTAREMSNVTQFPQPQGVPAHG